MPRVRAICSAAPSPCAAGRSCSAPSCSSTSSSSSSSSPLSSPPASSPPHRPDGPLSSALTSRFTLTDVAPSASAGLPTLPSLLLCSRARRSSTEGRSDSSSLACTALTNSPVSQNSIEPGASSAGPCAARCSATQRSALASCSLRRQAARSAAPPCCATARSRRARASAAYSSASTSALWSAGAFPAAAPTAVSASGSSASIGTTPLA
eukprot:scaffold14143_cov129-Isochrysis_galbana.AAC.6